MQEAWIKSHVITTTDYRGEIGVILINLSNEEFPIRNSDRIAQMVISKHERASFEIVNSHDDLDATERGTGGFGHTGVK